MGEGKATRAEAVTADFGKGVPVEVMQVGLPWAQQVMQNYEPADESATDENQPDENWRSIAPSAIRRT